jgi:hypothetical protein
VRRGSPHGAEVCTGLNALGSALRANVVRGATGEPYAVKAARTVRGGAERNVPQGNARAAYSTALKETSIDVIEVSLFLG